MMRQVSYVLLDMKQTITKVLYAMNMEHGGFFQNAKVCSFPCSHIIILKMTHWLVR